MVNFSKIANPPDEPDRIRMQPGFAVHEVLDRFETRITYEWLGIDYGPWFSPGTQDVSRVKIGHQQGVSGARLCEHFQHSQPFAHQTGIRPVPGLRHGLHSPECQHL